MPGAFKNSPGGCTCCPGCGLVSLPATLHFTIGGIAVALTGPGGTSGTWNAATGAIHAPGTEVTNCFPITTAAYVEMGAQFRLFTTPNSLGQCFDLRLNASWLLDAATCSVENFQSFIPAVPGCGGYSASGLAFLIMTGILNSFTWSPFTSSWTFGATWDGSPTRGSTNSGTGHCIAPLVAIGLTPPVSGAATLTH